MQFVKFYIYNKSTQKILKITPFILNALYANRIRFLRHDADPDPAN